MHHHSIRDKKATNCLNYADIWALVQKNFADIMDECMWIRVEKQEYKETHTNKRDIQKPSYIQIKDKNFKRASNSNPIQIHKVKMNTHSSDSTTI